MNLHVARRTAEQRTGSILSDVVVGGWRLRVAGSDAEAHLWDQRTRPTGQGRALGITACKTVFVWLERPEERR